MQQQDDLSIGIRILAFLLPIVGFIYYFSEKNSAPVKADSALASAFWGLGFGLLLMSLE